MICTGGEIMCARPRESLGTFTLAGCVVGVLLPALAGAVSPSAKSFVFGGTPPMQALSVASLEPVGAKHAKFRGEAELRISRTCPMPLTATLVHRRKQDKGIYVFKSVGDGFPRFKGRLHTAGEPETVVGMKLVLTLGRHDRVKQDDPRLVTVTFPQSDSGGYFPIGVGNTWSFEGYETGIGRLITTRTVTAVTGSRYVMDTRVFCGFPCYPTQTVANCFMDGQARYMTDGHWYSHGAGSFSYDPPYLLFPHQVAAGYEEDNGCGNTTGVQVEVRVEGFQTVTVPAGTFHACAVIRSTSSFMGEITGVTTSWWAPGVGEVRIEYGRDGSVAVEELVSYAVP
jgi:uncharacterized protein DUF3108